MSHPPKSTQALRALLIHRQKGADSRNLLLVDPAQDLPAALTGGGDLSLTVTRFETLTRSFLAQAAPELVLSPLFTERFDILDLARVLVDAKYCGALRAFSTPLPNFGAIRKEVRCEFPRLDFDILEIPCGSDRAN